MADQLVHVPHPEPGDRVHRGRGRAQSGPGHMPVRRGDQLQREVRDVLARLDGTADRRPAAAAQLQNGGRRVFGARVRRVHRHLDGSVQNAAAHAVHKRVRHVVQREPRMRLQVTFVRSFNFYSAPARPFLHRTDRFGPLAIVDPDTATETTYDDYRRGFQTVSVTARSANCAKFIRRGKKYLITRG